MTTALVIAGLVIGLVLGATLLMACLSEWDHGYEETVNSRMNTYEDDDNE